MAEVIRMPRMSDTMEEGVIVGWMKEVGDSVEPGDVLAEVETDKATMELESFQEGTLLYIGVKEGPVPVNGILAVIGEEGEEYQSVLDAANNSNGNGAAPAEKAEVAASTTATTNSTNTPSVSTTTDERLKASPLAKRMAADAGIDLTAVTGTGENGRIVKRDIEAYTKSANAVPSIAATTTSSPTPAPAKPAATTTPAPQPFVFSTNGDNYEDTPVSQMRKVIARRLGESKFSAPHFYLTVEINMDKAIKTRKNVNEKIAPAKISFNDLIVKAAAAALRAHPSVNSSWLGDTIRMNKDINVGVAVAVPDGLLVPVIRHADMKTLTQINAEVRHLAGKAKEKKLQPDEMQGNTFTISNLGMFGIEEFTAIINPPDACIMAVGSIIEKAVIKNGKLAVGNIMKVTLSCDHRVVDGATGAKFLQTFRTVLEDPIRILV